MPKQKYYGPERLLLHKTEISVPPGEIPFSACSVLKNI